MKVFLIGFMGSGKTHVVSVRVEPYIKAALQAAADGERRSVANMVEVMVLAYCKTNNVPVEGLVTDALRQVKEPK